MAEFHSIEGGLSDADINELDGLISIPSWYDAEKGVDEGDISEYIFERLQNCGCKVWKMGVEGKRQNIIVEKGDGSFVLWIIGHMDVNKPNIAWKTGCKLEQDGDFLKGLGVGDMKIGLLQMMKLAREADLPNGVKVVFMFLVDEELDSKGIKAVLNRTDFPKPDFVLSPEIPTPARMDLLQNEPSHPIIIARRGHAKYEGSVQITGETHGASGEIPEATTAYRQTMNLLFQMVYDRRTISVNEFKELRDKSLIGMPSDISAASIDELREYMNNWITNLCYIKPIHPLLPIEKLSERGIWTNSYDTTGTTSPRNVRFLLSHYFSPPLSLQENMAMFTMFIRMIIENCQFEKNGIKLDFAPISQHMQYNAYCMPSDNIFIDGLKKSASIHHKRKPVAMGGWSPTDMNIVAEKGFIGAEMTGDCWNEHGDGECALNRSARNNFEAMKHFITVEIPKILNKS